MITEGGGENWVTLKKEIIEMKETHEAVLDAIAIFA